MKIANQKKPLLIRLSMASKISKKNLFCSKYLPTMGVSTRFLCVIFYVLLQSLCKNSHTYHKKPVKSSTKLGKSQRKAQVNASMSHFYKFWLFCENCAKILESHMKNHRNLIMYWRP